MSNTKPGLKDILLGWLSKKTHSTQEVKLEASKEIKTENVQDKSEDQEIPVNLAASEGFIETPIVEPTSETLPELSDELQQLLQEKHFEPLCKTLRAEGITTVEQLKALQLWVFLNQHNLYSITERAAVFIYLEDQLNPAFEIEEKNNAEEPIVEEPIAEEEYVVEGELDIAEEPIVEGKSIVEEEPTNMELSSPQDPFITPYYKLYSINPEPYRSFPASDCGFSVRVSNRLMGHNIQNVAELLEQSDKVMLAISGFGANSLKELHAYFKKLANPDSAKASTQREKTSKRERDIQEAYDLIDVELIENVKKNEPAALAIIQMLDEFLEVQEQELASKTALAKIPYKRLILPAEDVINAYTDKEEYLSFLLERNDTGASFKQFVIKNAHLIVDKNICMAQFLRWCRYDVVSEIDSFFEESLKKDTFRRVFCGRVRGETLAQLGEDLGVTRERVRQIEAKIKRAAGIWFRNNRIIHKLFLDFDGETSLFSDQIAEYVGCYGLETVALLKEYSGVDYFYDNRLDLFTLGQAIDYDGLQEFVDSLPDLFVADKLDAMIEEGVQEHGFSEVQLRTVFDNSYRRTGDTYHRSRLTLGSIYGETLKKYYPNGIHLDDEEIKRFKKLTQDEFGVDLSDKNTHSISVIIARICILCGRGRYRLKSDSPYLSEGLTRRIRAYVESSTTPIMLLNTLFSEFEDELRAEGVNNRFYLQGILKELFGDIWYFKKDYVTTNPEVTSFYEAVGNYIAKASSPVSKEEVMRQFPGLTDIVLNQAIAGTDTLNLFGSYIGASRLSFSEDDVQYLHQKLEESLSKNEICYIRDLFNIVKLERPGMLSRNYINAGFALYSVLEYLFGNDYNFSRPFIAKEGAEIKSILSVLKEMVAEADLIEISDITSFASEHNYPIPSVIDFVNSCNATHLMINSRELATLEYIGVSAEIAKQIESLIHAEVDEAVPISHLTCVGQFPKLKVEWNAWLIYSILNKWSTDLSVGTSKALFKITYPVVAPAGASLEVEFDEAISHDGDLLTADNLDNIEELIADYISEELGDIDEF